MHKDKNSNAKIAVELNCEEDTVRQYVVAFNAGKNNISEYQDMHAKRQGYFSHNHRLACGKDRCRSTRKEMFEKNMETRGLIRDLGGALVENIIPYPDTIMSCDEALNILAKRNYSLKDVFSYWYSNPNGMKEVGVIKDIFYEKMPLKDIATSMNLTLERIRQIRDRGLGHLHDIIIGK